MATVRMSKSLIADIKLAVRNRQVSRETAFAKMPAGLGDRVYEIFIKRHEPVFQLTQSLGLQDVYFETSNKLRLHVGHETITLFLSRDVPFPPNVGTYAPINLPKCPEVDAVLADIEAWRQAKSAVYKENMVYLSSVEKFLNSQPSLNKALVVWPSLREFVPEAYLQRLDRKTSRSSSLSSEGEEFDVSSLEAEVVRFKVEEAAAR